MGCMRRGAMLRSITPRLPAFLRASVGPPLPPPSPSFGALAQSHSSITGAHKGTRRAAAPIPGSMEGNRQCIKPVRACSVARITRRLAALFLFVCNKRAHPPCWSFPCLESKPAIDAGRHASRTGGRGESHRASINSDSR